jgi:ADP-ribose pyrophosphatase
MSAPVDRVWKVRSKRSDLARPPWLEVFRETIDLPDGRTIDDFYSVKMQDFGVVAAFTESGEVVVERLYRHGPARLTWSLPAGYVDAGESPLDATVRELREETGYEASEWIFLGRFVVDGNRGCGWCHCFLANGASRVDEARSDDLAEVEVSLVSWERLIELLATGEVTELASAATLALARIHRGKPD